MNGNGYCSERHFSFSRLANVVMFTCSVLLLSTANGYAQYYSFELSTIHDQNIFDTYIPFPDQITQFQADISNDWDFDESSLTLSYNGSLSLFSDLTARNYHVHVVTLSSVFHFTHDEEENDGEESNEEEEMMESEGDTSDTVAIPVQSEPVIEHSDSADQFLYGTLQGAAQFDKDDFSQYDNSRMTGVVTFRQPISLNASIRPSYTISYHSYPNLSGITNVENIFSALIGTDFIPKSWASLSMGYGIKSYTTSTTYTYTVGSGGQAGHGKPGAGGSGKKTKSYVLDSPPVKQFSATVTWEQQISAQTSALGLYSHYGTPSTAARILPQQVQNAIEQQGTIGDFTSHNDIFDDHYGFSGDEFLLQVQQTMPFEFVALVKSNFVQKKYTIPAYDLSDTVIVAGNREDTRFELEINISRMFEFGEGKSIKPRIEFHYLRNRSNAPYYDIDKNTFLLGCEFNF